MIRTTALAVLMAASFSASASEEAKAGVDLAKAKQIAETVCVACHSADGNSQVPGNPNLAGQIQAYLYKQLSNFKSIDGSKPPVRNSPIMGGMVAALNDEDMRSLSVYFAQQKVNSSATTTDAKLVAEGQQLWRKGDFDKGIPACAGCHGAVGAGLPAQYPRLAGQHAEYTEGQLVKFRNDERANDAEKMMRTISGRLSDRQMKAAAEYMASLR